MAKQAVSWNTINSVKEKHVTWNVLIKTYNGSDWAIGRGSERMAFYSENLPRLFSEKITAVFAVSDHYALEFMRFLQGQGIRVPEDVQIIGFDDTLASRESVPALTTIHQDAALRARTAIRRLEALRDGTPCDAGIVLPVELVERESTRRLPCQTL